MGASIRAAIYIGVMALAPTAWSIEAFASKIIGNG
jgi:hypothetical protein